MTEDKATRRFRHATMSDLPRMRVIYQRARELMAANGNPTQWGSTFPRESVVIDDIKRQRMMLLVVTDFPLPDSPTIANVSPLFK